MTVRQNPFCGKVVTRESRPTICSPACSAAFAALPRTPTPSYHLPALVFGEETVMVFWDKRAEELASAPRLW